MALSCPAGRYRTLFQGKALEVFWCRLSSRLAAQALSGKVEMGETPTIIRDVAVYGIRP